MTEAEWMIDDKIHRMLDQLRFHLRVSDRKRYLFACACCRRIWQLIHDEPWRKAVELMEGYADGLGISAQVDAVREAAGKPHDNGSMAAEAVAEMIRSPNSGLNRVSRHVALAVASQSVPEYPANREVGENAGVAELVSQCALLREVFGNPFRPVVLQAAWRTPSVLALALAAYDHLILPAGTLSQDRLAVLSDALEEAGCDSADLLSHLRGPGPHVRGCWVVDLLLGKE